MSLCLQWLLKCLNLIADVTSSTWAFNSFAGSIVQLKWLWIEFSMKPLSSFECFNLSSKVHFPWYHLIGEWPLSKNHLLVSSKSSSPWWNVSVFIDILLSIRFVFQWMFFKFPRQFYFFDFTFCWPFTFWWNWNIDEWLPSFTKREILPKTS